CIPIYSRTQKLSKIETLRLARNYIHLMVTILRSPDPLDTVQFAKLLSKGISQGTTNLIAGFLNLNPRTLLPQGYPKPLHYAVFEPIGILPEYRIPSPPPVTAPEECPYGSYMDTSVMTVTSTSQPLEEYAFRFSQNPMENNIAIADDATIRSFDGNLFNGFGASSAKPEDNFISRKSDTSNFQFW
ncbi:unnamed protein product, partial [Allacma fusca]